MLVGMELVIFVSIEAHTGHAIVLRAQGSPDVFHALYGLLLIFVRCRVHGRKKDK
tara:strand:+ start:2347 stop:2511 length:165 start_codon:yes stop_codon:yes gene_type:complete